MKNFYKKLMLGILCMVGLTFGLNAQDLTDTTDTGTTTKVGGFLQVNGGSKVYGDLEVSGTLTADGISGGDLDTITDVSTKHDNRLLADSLDTKIDSNTTKLNDTAAFYLSLVFGAGSKHPADTGLFEVGSWCGSTRNQTGDTLYIDSLNAALQGTSPSIGIQFYIDDTLGAVVPDSLHTSLLTVNSTTVGNTFTTFGGTTKIPPLSRIWCEIRSVATKPTYLEITMSTSIR